MDPCWWLATLSLAGWAVLAVHPESAVSGSAHGGRGQLVLRPAAMVLATMLPLSFPLWRYVAHSSFWLRRHRTVGIVAAGFLVTAIALMVMVELVVMSLAAVVGALATATMASLLALGWEASRRQRRYRRQCARYVALPAAGWGAMRAAWNEGHIAALRCMRTCWPVMALLSALGHSMLLLVLATGFLMYGRFGQRFTIPRALALLGTGSGIAILIQTFFTHGTH
ncbi:MAG: DUF2182 domain-containing protein [Gemmatimonas sp.]